MHARDRRYAHNQFADDTDIVTILRITGEAGVPLGTSKLGALQMADHRLIVFSDAVPGQEEEYQRWYDDKHLGDVLTVPGVIAAQRFVLVKGSSRGFAAIYELDTDDADAVIEEILARAGTDKMPLSPAFNQDAGFDLFAISQPSERLTC